MDVRGKLVELLYEFYGCDPMYYGVDALAIAQHLTANGVAPVVRCKDCEYSYEEISYLCCSHGVCVDCVVPPNFSCAYGKRREENEE